MRHEFFGSIKKHEVSRGEGSIKRHEVLGSIKRHEVSGGETNNGSIKAHEIKSPSKDMSFFTQGSAITVPWLPLGVRG